MLLLKKKLSVSQPVNQTMTAGFTNKYPIQLNDGDYVDVSLASQSPPLTYSFKLIGTGLVSMA